MHRSGTSATTGFITSLGAYPGKNIISGNTFNPKGYFECNSIVAYNDKLFRELNSCWFDFNELELASIKENERISKEISSIIEAEFHVNKESLDLTIIKDPRMCRLLPVWEPLIKNKLGAINYIITLRHPRDVILSLAKRDGFSTSLSALIYISYLLDAEIYTRGQRRLLIKYSDLVKNPSTIIKKLYSTFGTSFHQANEDTLYNAYSFIENKLDHHNDDFQIKKFDDPFLLMDLSERLYYTFITCLDKSTSEFDEIRENFNSIIKAAKSLDFSQIKKTSNAITEIDDLNLPLSTDTISKLYFSYKKYDFSEEQTIKKTFRFDRHFSKLEFEFSKITSQVSAVRLDITDRPACCEIKYICLLDSTGNIHWKQNSHIAISSTSPDMNLLPIKKHEDKEDGLIFMNTGFDPYAILKIPEDKLALISEGWKLVVDVRISLTSFSTNLIYEKLTEELTINSKISGDNLKTTPCENKKENQLRVKNNIKSKIRKIKSIYPFNHF